MLPGIMRWSDSKVLDEAANRIARMALGACDGLAHGSSFYPAWVSYPTRRNTEALIRLVLTPDPEADAGYQRGFSLDELFAAAWERVVADEGDDQAALDLLVAYHAEISGLATATPTTETASAYVFAEPVEFGRTFPTVLRLDVGYERIWLGDVEADGWYGSIALETHFNRDRRINRR